MLHSRIISVLMPSLLLVFLAKPATEVEGEFQRLLSRRSS